VGCFKQEYSNAEFPHPGILRGLEEVKDFKNQFPHPGISLRCIPSLSQAERDAKCSMLRGQTIQKSNSLYLLFMLIRNNALER
jgi:hypothetical protein